MARQLQLPINDRRKQSARRRLSCTLVRPGTENRGQPFSLFSRNDGLVGYGSKCPASQMETSCIVTTQHYLGTIWCCGKARRPFATAGVKWSTKLISSGEIADEPAGAWKPGSDVVRLVADWHMRGPENLPSRYVLAFAL